MSMFRGLSFTGVTVMVIVTSSEPSGFRVGIQVGRLRDVIFGAPSLRLDPIGQRRLAVPVSPLVRKVNPPGPTQAMWILCPATAVT